MAEVEKLKYVSTFFLMDGNSPNKYMGSTQLWIREQKPGNSVELLLFPQGLTPSGSGGR